MELLSGLIMNDQAAKTQGISDRLTAVIGRNSTTPEGVVNKLNGLLGKNIQSPRDDLPGTVEVFQVYAAQIIQHGPESYYGVAVVEIGVRKEQLDVERQFFANAPVAR